MIKEEEKEIYHYGYETLIYSIQQMMLILILGMIINRKIETFTFLMVFVSMRKYTGGYHARSRIGCTFMTVVCYLMVFLFGQWLMNRQKSYIILAFMVLLCISVFIKYVPMEHPDKPLTKIQRRESRKKCGLLFMFYLIISLLIYDVYRIVTYMVLCTMVVTAMLIIIQKRKGGNENEEISIKNSSNDW